MAHFAEIDKDNIVIRVLVVDDEYENNGQEFLADKLGFGGTWIQTSYNGNIRKNYAGIGFTYDADLDAFIPPKLNCHDEEIFNSDICKWECDNEAHNGN